MTAVDAARHQLRVMMEMTIEKAAQDFAKASGWSIEECRHLKREYFERNLSLRTRMFLEVGKLLIEPD
jgi:hypothetical protein